MSIEQLIDEIRECSNKQSFVRINFITSNIE